MKKSLIFVGMLAVGYANAQYDGKVGVNTTEPKATLDITAYKTDSKETLNDGLLIPRLSKERVAAMATPEASTLVYVNDVTYTTGNDTNADSRVAKVDAKGFYYYDGTIWVKVKSDATSEQGVNKTLVYTSSDPNSSTAQFGTVPSSDPSFVSTPSLAQNTDYIYVDPTGYTWIWSPTESKYVEGPSFGSDVLFYKAGTFEDAIGKNKDMYRAGKLGIGISKPISSIHTRGYISAPSGSSLGPIYVDSSTGGNSDTDMIFNTLEEAITHANSITNNGIVVIQIEDAQASIDKPVTITRNMRIGGRNTTSVSKKIVDLNAIINVTNGVTFGFVEGYGLEVNQNVPVAINTFGNNTINLGGYSGIKWNFTQNDQRLLSQSYSGTNQNSESHLGLSRVTFNTNSHTGLGWAKVTNVNTGLFNISYWNTTLPEGMSYQRVGRVVDGNGLWQNFSGSYLAFSGLDTTNNNALVERMRIHTNGNVGIGVTAPSEKLHINGSVMATSYKGSNGATLFPDYVFQKYYTGNSSIKADYTFKTLSQVEDFVKTNGHLPGYKSAEAIKAQGYVDLMETQLTNVEKIEELYLHSIEQEKAIKAKDAKIQELESRLEKLEKLLK